MQSIFGRENWKKVNVLVQGKYYTVGGRTHAWRMHACARGLLYVGTHVKCLVLVLVLSIVLVTLLGVWGNKERASADPFLFHEFCN